MLIFYRPKKENSTMENYLELMRQARVYLYQHPEVIPLEHVREVAFYGGVDRYVVAGGVDIHTPEGNRILNWEMALHSVCRDLCDMGAGNRPYMPVPYLQEPVIVAEEGEEAAAGIQPQQPPVQDPIPAEPVPAQPDNPAVRIIRVEGNVFPPPPPLHPAPVAYRPQPLHWVFREPPRLKAKPKIKLETKTEPGAGEYTEPADGE
jgi:hypothetical protein